MVTYIPKTVQRPLLRQILTTHIPKTTKEIGELKDGLEGILTDRGRREKRGNRKVGIDSQIPLLPLPLQTVRINSQIPLQTIRIGSKTF